MYPGECIEGVKIGRIADEEIEELLSNNFYYGF